VGDPEGRDEAAGVASRGVARNEVPNHDGASGRPSWVLDDLSQSLRGGNRRFTPHPAAGPASRARSHSPEPARCMRLLVHLGLKRPFSPLRSRGAAEAAACSGRRRLVARQDVEAAGRPSRVRPCRATAWVAPSWLERRITTSVRSGYATGDRLLEVPTPPDCRSVTQKRTRRRDRNCAASPKAL
jgi:hypothetical protein